MRRVRQPGSIWVGVVMRGGVLRGRDARVRLVGGWARHPARRRRRPGQGASPVTRRMACPTVIRTASTTAAARATRRSPRARASLSTDRTVSSRRTTDVPGPATPLSPGEPSFLLRWPRAVGDRLRFRHQVMGPRSSRRPNSVVDRRPIAWRRGGIRSRPGLGRVRGGCLASSSALELIPDRLLRRSGDHPWPRLCV